MTIVFWFFCSHFFLCARRASATKMCVCSIYIHGGNQSVEEVDSLPSLDFAGIVTQASTLRRFWSRDVESERSALIRSRSSRSALKSKKVETKQFKKTRVRPFSSNLLSASTFIYYLAYICIRWQVRLFSANYLNVSATACYCLPDLGQHKNCLPALDTQKTEIKESWDEAIQGNSRQAVQH